MPLPFSFQEWIIDSGPTNHMVYSTPLLTFVSSFANHIVKLPNGAIGHVIDIGTVHLLDSLVLKNVLCYCFFFEPHFSS